MLDPTRCVSHAKKLRLVIQRVLSASVSSQGVTNTTAKGYMCLVGISSDDEDTDLQYCLNKLLSLKLFDAKSSTAAAADDEVTDTKPWSQSIKDISGDILLVSQFTLFARTSKGSKPDFHLAMTPQKALEIFNSFVAAVRAKHKEGKVETGFFGQYMQLNVQNDGPVTIIVDSKTR